jgi:hypothetical protein
MGNYCDKLENTFRLCKVLFLLHRCNITNLIFLDLVRDQNIQEKKI